MPSWQSGGGIAAFFEPGDRFVDMRLQQMYQTNLVQNIADIGIAGTKTMACCANGITSSIEPVRSLHAPRSQYELGQFGFSASAVSYS